ARIVGSPYVPIAGSGYRPSQSSKSSSTGARAGRRLSRKVICMAKTNVARPPASGTSRARASRGRGMGMTPGSVWGGASAPGGRGLTSITAGGRGGGLGGGHFQRVGRRPCRLGDLGANRRDAVLVGAHLVDGLLEVDRSAWALTDLGPGAGADLLLDDVLLDVG